MAKRISKQLKERITTLGTRIANLGRTEMKCPKCKEICTFVDCKQVNTKIVCPSCGASMY